MSSALTRSFTRLAVAIVIAAAIISAAALSYSAVEATVTKTSTFTTLPMAITVTAVVNRTTTISVYGGTELVGNCVVTNYFVPDTVEAFQTTITVSSGNSTYTYTTFYQVGPVTDTQASTSYPTTIYANSTGTFTFVSTSTGDYSPSEGWTVTACTFVS